jgi:hypothetical protein
MRKAINISALLFFVWLVLDTLNAPSALLNFLLVGELPGTTTALSPTLMLALMTAATGLIVFELAARRIEIVWRIRQQFIQVMTRRQRLPRRRFSRI